MIGDGDLEKMVLGIIERWSAGRFSERHGLVTSYDPKNYLAKVTFQPEGQESGWLPIETGHIGNGFGIVIGLATGDGKADGDQVIVRYQENDFESGKIVQRVHSDNDTPPEVQSGEVMILAKFKNDSNPGPDTPGGGQGGGGQQIYLKNDGSMTLTDGNGATYMLDGAGNITITAKSVTYNVSGAVTVNGQTIDLVGNVHLGSSAGVPAAMQGTVDTGGNADVSNLATKVWVT